MDENLDHDKLLELCNNEEEFRQTIITLLTAKDVTLFDSLCREADQELPARMSRFLNDLREVYNNESLRKVIVNLLNDSYSVPEMRGIQLLVQTHVMHQQHVQELNQTIYEDARDTVQSYLPAFQELINFLERLPSEPEERDTELLKDSFLTEIAEAVEEDTRINSSFLLNICKDQEYRDTLAETLESYPSVVQYIFGLADQLNKAQKCIEEIEIDEMLHDIEGSDQW